MNRNRLDIYKASAGAGKTYTLAHRYIEMMLERPDWSTAYRHILAVTFTNKATEEMKGRILEYLFNLSCGDREELKRMKEFMKRADEGPGLDAEIQHKSALILKNILHDYSNYEVTTIDKFFQHVYRSFARELGHYSAFKVELDQDSVMSRALDEMLSCIDSDDMENPGRLFKAVRQFAIDLLRLRNKTDYVAELASFASLFKKEDFFLKKKDGSWSNPEEVAGRADCYIESFNTDLLLKAESVSTAVSNAGLSLDGFNRGVKSSFYCCLSKWLEGKIEKPSDGFLKFVSSQDSWFTKSDKQASSKVAALCSEGFEEKLFELAGMFGYDPVTRECSKDETNPFFVYNTAKAVRKNISVLLIAQDINDAVDRYLKDNGLMLLSDTCHALNSIIDGCDTPFIYEKTGNWLDHYLLDEFQDFSVVQWQNFRPLLRQSLDSGHSDLIVGDVKQSIYRWRGSDWKTLDKGLAEDLADESLEFPPLGVNQRSDEVIVNFNNDFFAWVSNSFDDERIKQIYSGCEQEFCKSGKGRVKVRFVDGDEEESDALELLKDEIGSLQARGCQLKDIAILVRRNEEADEVAARLIADGISVITEESLKVGAAVSVRKVVSVLKAMSNRNDERNSYLMSHLGVDMDKLDAEVKSRPLYEMVESIAMSFEGGVPSGEMPYFMAFMDIVVDYVSQNGSDVAGFLGWWEESGSKQTISAPKSADAVSIMTIHKAKGLGMPVVIIPLFSERLMKAGNRTDYIWCYDSSDELDAGLVPLECSSALDSTLFCEENAAERQYYKVDALNTAYVAFTRPKNELIVYAKKPKEISSGLKQESVSDKLYKYLYDNGNLSEENIFEAGSLFRYDSDEIESAVLRIESYSSVRPEGSNPDKPRLHLIGRGKDFFEKEKVRLRGIVMHDILSAITTADDIEAAVQDGVARGEIVADEAPECVAEIRRMVESASSYGWFDKGAEVLNEVSIIDAEGNVGRPDRVVVTGGSGCRTAVVVDYKFGGKNPEYAKQVARYMALLSEMGYAEVKGYLWYAAAGEIVPVDNNL